jgi:APA family basic amino acid/polyamine antiporter
LFACFAYTELAAMIPTSGSSYTYAYVSIGEFAAWIVAWGLILEYTIGASTVASGWSGYFTGILKSANIDFPEYLTKVPSNGGIINLPAVFISSFVGILLIRGVKESLMVNRVLVAVKIIVIFLFFIIATPNINFENYVEFAPFGFNGIIIGAATVFFAFVGFDAVATSAEEAKNPNRDLPIGIVGSLLVSTLLYVLVSLVLTGITHYSELNNSEPVSYALRKIGSNVGSALVGTGAMAGMTSVLLVLMYGQSRISFVMSRDGLIPAFFSRLHKKFTTPHISCLAITVVVSLISGFVPIHILGELTSIGTLLAFIVSALGMIVLRILYPKVNRPFKCPYPFFIGGCAIFACGYLFFSLVLIHGKIFFSWILIGAVVYFLYGIRKSNLNKK